MESDMKTTDKTDRLKFPEGIQRRGFLDVFPGYVILLPVYFVLFLFYHNMDSIGGGEIAGPLMISVAAGIIIFEVFYFFIRNTAQSGVCAVSFILVIFLYGRGVDIFQNMSKGQGGIAAYYLPALAGFLFIAAVNITVFILKGDKKFRIYGINRFLNIFSFLLISVVLVQILAGSLHRYMVLNGKAAEYTMGKAEYTEETPDIYYIIIDGRARSDVLRELYNYDDSAFILSMKEKGFRIPAKSRANYAQTLLSVSSLMNYKYLDSTAEEAGKNSGNRSFLYRNIRFNKAVEILKDRGYEIYVLPGGYYDDKFTGWADVVLKPEGKGLELFEGMFKDTTILRLADIVIEEEKRLSENYTRHINRINYNFDKLGGLPKLKGKKPKFVFTHIICPHPPFIFRADGTVKKQDKKFKLGDGSHRKLEKKEYTEGYREQTAYVDKMIDSLAERILVNSKKPPVIIIHADHGPGSELTWEDRNRTNVKERLAIFSAYYLPGIDAEKIPEDMSSVNNFRLLFSEYFGKDLEMLENRAYFSRWSRPYDFFDVTEEVRR